MNITDEFLDKLDKFCEYNYKIEIVNKLKYLLIDYIGVTLAGAKINREKIDIMLEEDGLYKPLGIEKGVSVKDAVFINGLNAHTLDYDDGCNKGIIHLGSVIFSALLPLAWKYKISGERFIKSAIIGYETTFSMAKSIQPKHKEMGFHATGTCGTLGVAMAIAYMLDFTKKQRKDTFSAACVSATGILKVLEGDSQLKPYNVGKAALLGVISANMGKAGYNGPEDVLGGKNGYLQLMYGKETINMDNIFNIDETAVMKAYIKPYAACRYCHPSIEAAINIKNKHDIDIDNISEINISTYYWAVNKHDHTDIKGSASAKMSIPYGVAVGMTAGRAGLKEYNEKYISDSKITALTKKVKVSSSDKLTELFPEKTVAELNVKTGDGRVINEIVEMPKGEPENPLSYEELEEKFYELSDLDRENSKRIMELVSDLESKLQELIENI